MATGKKTLLGVFLGAIALSFFLYGNSIDGEFVYDDRAFVDLEEFKGPDGLERAILDPLYVAKTTGSQSIRPLSSVSFALNFALFGDSPVSFHVVNVLLHALVAFLVFVLVDRLFHRPRLSLFTAVLFLFLPIHTEAVAFIKARDEILLAVFVLLSWIAFIRATYQDKVNWLCMAGSVALLFLALLSKEFAVTIPFLFLFVYHVQKKPSFARLLTLASAFLPAYAAYALLAREVLFKAATGNDATTFVINPLQYVSAAVRVWTAFTLLPIYLWKSVVPLNLSASYDYNQIPFVHNPLVSPQALLGMALFAVLVSLMFYKKTRATPIGIGAATFFIPYLVFSKLFFVGGQTMGERWVYFASIGVCLWMAYGLEHLYVRKKIATILMLVGVLVAYGAVIIRRNPVWKTERSVYESMVKSAPNSIQGHKALALADLQQGDYGPAMGHIDECMRIHIGYTPTRSMLKHLAAYYSETGGKTSGIVTRGSGELNQVLLALAQAKDGMHEESLATLEGLLADYPSRAQSPIVRFTFALNYHRLGNEAARDRELPWVPGETYEDKLESLRVF